MRTKEIILSSALFAISVIIINRVWRKTQSRSSGFRCLYFSNDSFPGCWHWVVIEGDVDLEEEPPAPPPPVFRVTELYVLMQKQEISIISIFGQVLNCQRKNKQLVFDLQSYYGCPYNTMLSTYSILHNSPHKEVNKNINGYLKFENFWKYCIKLDVRVDEITIRERPLKI